jgi:hypothetical protein
MVQYITHELLVALREWRLCIVLTNTMVRAPQSTGRTSATTGWPTCLTT